MKQVQPQDVKRLVEVPILIHGQPQYDGLSVVMVEAHDGTESFYYKKGKQMVIPEYTDADWELFDRLASHVGWYDECAYDKPQK